MVFSVYQAALKIFKTNIIEIQFSVLFVSTIIVNKYVLSKLGFREPTVFQGWQTFTCVVLLSVLLKFQNGMGEIKILDRRTFFLMLPGFICFATSIVAGSKGLSELPVPVFCAILSLIPAILVLLDKRTDSTEDSKRVCGSAAICGTVVVTLVMTLTKWNTEGYLWLLVHVVLSIIYSVYMERISVELSSIAKIYYRNFFSIIVLLPLSIYLNVLYVPWGFSWQFYVGCILSGVLGTFLQIVMAKIEQKPSYMNCQGRAKLVCSLIGHNIFFANVEPVIWFVIIINLLVNSFFLSPDAESIDAEKKQKLGFVVGHPRRNLSMEKIISV